MHIAPVVVLVDDLPVQDVIAIVPDERVRVIHDVVFQLIEVLLRQPLRRDPRVKPEERTTFGRDVMVFEPLDDVVADAPAVLALSRLEDLEPGVVDVVGNGAVVEDLREALLDFDRLRPDEVARFAAKVELVLTIHAPDVALRLFELDLFASP